MDNNSIEVISYNKSHQIDLDLMLKEIALEFAEPISNAAKTKTKIALTKYWVALKKKKAIGTIGLISVNDEYCILVKMFVAKLFRGKKYGVSKLLLEEAINWCKENEIPNIYLGTMNQFRAAHRFYEKNDFRKIEETKLPKSFLANPIDDTFYFKAIKN